MISGWRALLFDFGGVFEDLEVDEGQLEKGLYKIKSLLNENLPDISSRWSDESIMDGLKAYQDWSKKSFRELASPELWSNFLLREWGVKANTIRSFAEDMSYILEFFMYRRRLRPEGKSTLREIKRLGYLVGLVSNTISQKLIPDRLKMYNLWSYFDVVTLSSVIGVRKPAPEIFRETLDRLNVRAWESIFVGDTISRDVVGAKAVGFGCTIMIESGVSKIKDEGNDKLEPDLRIRSLDELLNIL
jgi:putative hydrolase of the HAD superfamily